MSAATKARPAASSSGDGGGDEKKSGARVAVQRFGTFLSNMVMPNIAAFIAWGLITAIVIEVGWVTVIGDAIGYEGGYGPIELLGGWGAGSVDEGGTGGIVGPMITFLLPLLIGYTGGKMMHEHRGGVVGAIATTGVIVGTSIPMFLGAMIMGPLGGWTMKKLDQRLQGGIRPGFEMLVNNFSAGIWGMVLAVLGFFVFGPLVTAFSDLAGSLVSFLVDNGLLPLTSIFIEPAKVLFLNNAINHGVLTPLATAQVADGGSSILFLLEANPGPGLGLLLAYTFFGKGMAKASAPGAAVIHFIGGIHEIYFPYVLMNPKLIVAMIAGGMSQIFVLVLTGAGLQAPAAPGSIIAVLAVSPVGSIVGVLLSVAAGAAASFFVASIILKADSDVEGDLSEATGNMEAMKGKKSSAAAALRGGEALEADADDAPINDIVFACDAGMGSSAMGASVLRKKVHGAGYEKVTVVNKAISDLKDEYDLVVVHQDLADRASEKTPSARLVTVDNFMGSPKYDEIVEMLHTTNGDGGGSGGGETIDVTDDDADGDVTTADQVLPREAIVLGGSATTRDEAIDEAGRLLMEAGAVDQAYVDAMHERESSVSTHMGNGLAIPHGTNEAKSAINRTAMTFVRYDEPIDWNGKPARFVLGIAGQGDDHMSLLKNVARVFADDEQVAQLEAASSPQDVLDVLDGVKVG